MKSLNKILCRLLFIAICLSFVYLFGCNKIRSYTDLPTIYHKDILSISDSSSYYVFIYRPNCEVCNEIEKNVLKYAITARDDTNLKPIYGLNRGDKNNSTLTGKDKCVDIDLYNATSYEQIQVCSSPWLFLINNHKIEQAWDTKTDILKELSIN